MRGRCESGARGPRRVLALVAVVLLAASCSSDGGEATAPTTSTTDPSLTPSGTSIGDSGLEVPDGAHLAGPAFGGGMLEEPGWGALVTVDDDPFAVFDALAGQLRDIGLPMPGTGASCRWLLEPGEDRPSGPAVAAGDPTAPIQHLLCGATAWSGPDQVAGRPTRAGLRLIWGGAATGAIWVDWATTPSGRPAGAYGDAPGFDPTVGAPSDVAEDPLPAAPGPEPVPSDARTLLPTRAGADPGVGDRFGGGANCQSGGEDRFRLPAGARLVATQGIGDAHAVLAVDDVEQVLDALTAQAGGSDGFNVDTVRTATAPDGQEVARRAFSVVGGGACELLESPDGTHVLISGHAD